jgi:hypothetical protein
MKEPFTEFVQATAPWVGFVVLFVCALALLLLLAVGCLRLVLALMRHCKEIRYGLIGVFGAKKMSNDVRRHLGKLVEAEAIRIVNKMHKTGELPPVKGEEDGRDTD